MKYPKSSVAMCVNTFAIVMLAEVFPGVLVVTLLICILACINTFLIGFQFGKSY